MTMLTSTYPEMTSAGFARSSLVSRGSRPVPDTLADIRLQERCPSVKPHERRGIAADAFQVANALSIPWRSFLLRLLDV